MPQEPKITYKKWEGEPLGKLRSEMEVRKHFGMGKDDVAYMIFIDGKLTIFQYHRPFQGGMTPMKEDDWEKYAKEHVERLKSRIPA